MENIEKAIGVQSGLDLVEASNIEGRILQIEKRVAEAQSLGGSSTSVWIEIEKLLASLPDLCNSFAAPHAALPDEAGAQHSVGDDPFKRELIESVRQDLSTWATDLEGINDIMSQSAGIVDGPAYEHVKLLKPRLDCVMVEAADLAARAIIVSEGVDRLLNRYETIVESCNALFVLVDEKLLVLEEKKRLGLL